MPPSPIRPLSRHLFPVGPYSGVDTFSPLASVPFFSVLEGDRDREKRREREWEIDGLVFGQEEEECSAWAALFSPPEALLAQKFHLLPTQQESCRLQMVASVLALGCKNGHQAAFPVFIFPLANGVANRCRKSQAKPGQRWFYFIARSWMIKQGICNP